MTATTPDLCSYVSGLTALAARPPRYPSIQLALDASGRLQLLLHARRLPNERALLQLYEARAWAVEHRELLALTCPDRCFDRAAGPSLHLFTAEPRSIAPLAFAGGGETPAFHLHLLKAVTVADKTTWLHAAIS